MKIMSMFPYLFITSLWLEICILPSLCVCVCKRLRDLLDFSLVL